MDTARDKEHPPLVLRKTQKTRFKN